MGSMFNIITNYICPKCGERLWHPHLNDKQWYCNTKGCPEYWIPADPERLKKDLEALGKEL